MIALLCAIAGLVVGAVAMRRWDQAQATQNALVAALRLNVAHGRVRYWQGQTAIAQRQVSALTALNREWEHDLSAADRLIAELEQELRVDHEFDRIAATLRPSGTNT